jgi:rod shape-determining protein MreC
VYPPGVPVAKVASIDRRAEAGFARIVLTPVAGPDGVRHVLVLEPTGLQLPAPAASAVEPAGKPGAKKKARRG